MTSWMAERDRLLAQADSLVKSVSQARPVTAPARPAPDQAVYRAPERAPPVQPAQAPASYTARPRPIESEADHAPLTFRRAAKSEGQPMDVISIPMLASTDREDMEIRVRRFREHQTKLAMERQSYCEKVQSDVRAKLRQYPDS